MSNFKLYNFNQEGATFYIKAKTSLICPGIQLDKYEIEIGKLVLSISFSYGLVGAEGTIAVGVPPTNEDIDVRIVEVGQNLTKDFNSIHACFPFFYNHYIYPLKHFINLKFPNR